MRKLNVLTYRWHVPHQYELWRLGHHITMVTGAGTSMCEAWEYGQRPLPQNAAFKSVEVIKPEHYDLAILHFDENILRPDLCNGKKTEEWGMTFTKMLALTANMPRVAICHGTPQFAGQHDSSFYGPGPVKVHEDSRKQLVDTLGNILVVCNSHQAEQEWRFQNSKTIWHGFSQDEFLPGTHERDCLAPSASTISIRGYYMGHFELERLKALLEGKLSIDYTVTPEPKGSFPDQQTWAMEKFKNYRNEIGKYTFYLNPTLRSPMPRSRSEAMMSGVIPLTLRNHDVDMFIQNGVNGYYADSVEELADFAIYLKKHVSIRKKMSVAARESALHFFSIKRYLKEWSNIIHTLT